MSSKMVELFSILWPEEIKFANKFLADLLSEKHLWCVRGATLSETP